VAMALLRQLQELQYFALAVAAVLDMTVLA
jgi:hypothetical protein